MTKTELTCADPGIATARQQYNTRPVERAAETNRSERRHPVIGVLTVLATAVVFYGVIAIWIRKLL